MHREPLAAPEALAPPRPDEPASFAEYVASTVAVPQPGWRTLSVARDHRFTGEIRFESEPVVLVYVDAGSVYHAERWGAPPIGRRLVDAGALTLQQLERGVVRVGEQEHLGRLFDRDDTIDREAVIAVVDAETDAVVAELSADVVASVTAHSYRHHSSGIHRWYVAPAEAALSRPLGGVTQVDRSVVEDLPDLITSAPRLRIEWNEPTLTGAVRPLSEFEPDDAATRVVTGAGDGTTHAPDGEPRHGPASEIGVRSATGASASDPDDFVIVWPDGTLESTTANPAAPATTATPPVPGISASTTAPVPSARPAIAGAMPDVAVTPPSHAPPVPASGGSVRFEIPPLAADAPHGGGAIDGGDVPDDVAEAVRRALQAIEQASGDTPVSPVRPAPAAVDPAVPTPDAASDASHGLPPVVQASVAAPAPTLPAAAPAAPPPTAVPAPALPAVSPPPIPAVPSPTAASPFAPPTPETSAEAVYAAAARAEPPAKPARETVELPGAASIVFVEDDESDERGTTGRKGALRRLIKSLRRSD